MSNCALFKRDLKYFYSLAPKTYFAIDFDDQKKFKRSSKGVQHSVLLTYDQYKDACYKNETVDVVNRVIRQTRGEMCTMACRKIALRNVFTKAYVAEDKITIRPFEKFKQRSSTAQ